MIDYKVYLLSTTKEKGCRETLVKEVGRTSSFSMYDGDFRRGSRRQKIMVSVFSKTEDEVSE